MQSSPFGIWLDWLNQNTSGYACSVKVRCDSARKNVRFGKQPCSFLVQDRPTRHRERMLRKHDSRGRRSHFA